METYTDTPYYSFKESTTDALLDKEGYLLALDTNEGTAKLATSVTDAIAVLQAKQEGNPHINARLLGKGGTVKVVAGGAIPKGSRVIWGTGGKVIVVPASAGTYRTLGIKLSQGTSANNDVIEILDVIESVTVA